MTRPVCETCRFWRRRGKSDRGECRGPHGWVGLEYDDGSMARWWITGKYATCRDHQPAA